MASNDELSSVNIEARLVEFEKKLDLLYRQYEQYFVGVDKRPPHQGLRDVVRLFRELEQLPMIRTDLKFRYRSLTQRFNSYRTYWMRIERQIEEGTYHRDLARARERKARRAAQAEQAELAGAPGGQGRGEDGAFELDDWEFEELDLGDLEQELAAMDQRGEFEKYVDTRKVQSPGREPMMPGREPAMPGQQAWSAQPAQPAASAQTYQRGDLPQVDETLKQKRLAELQAKLGLSVRSAPAPGPTPAAGANPFERGQEGVTQKARPENPQAPSRGADMSKLHRLKRARERLSAQLNQSRESASPATPAAAQPTATQPLAAPARARTEPAERNPRVIVRRGEHPATPAAGAAGGFSEERSRQIYNTLLEAKQRCQEDVSRLNYDTFKNTIERQRTQLQRTKGAREVDFKVVIKDGRAFLKPETKE